MDRHPKAGLDPLRQGPCAERLRSAELVDEDHDGVVQFVRVAGAAFLRQQSRQAAIPERRLCLVKGRARHATRGRGHPDGVALDARASEHLVLDLHQVPPVEEGVGVEQRIAHGLGVRVQRALGAERGEFGVWMASHGIDNYAAYDQRCQGRHN